MRTKDYSIVANRVKVSITMPDWLHDKVCRNAAHLGFSLSDQITRLAERWVLEQEASLAEIARAAKQLEGIQNDDPGKIHGSQGYKRVGGHHKP